ncbi:Hypothetical protein P9303_12661 [Prochlorococcus marinus str. MIT 9303]|uniref:Uncharacterized protein n=1 Tax=Prochlorococcus marinus (strain MIT 9303) TaxID=59922 RepID=A2C953_PROM3|nr:Hypothetical protein P9303_12661 [Prochlorococcus marinus str. MIT 9303]
MRMSESSMSLRLIRKGLMAMEGVDLAMTRGFVGLFFQHFGGPACLFDVESRAEVLLLRGGCVGA